MENNKRKRWQNGKVLMAGVLSAAMILQPMTVLAADTQADETEKKWFQVKQRLQQMMTFCMLRTVVRQIRQ